MSHIDFRTSEGRAIMASLGASNAAEARSMISSGASYSSSYSSSTRSSSSRSSDSRSSSSGIDFRSLCGRSFTSSGISTAADARSMISSGASYASSYDSSHSSSSPTSSYSATKAKERLSTLDSRTTELGCQVKSVSGMSEAAEIKEASASTPQDSPSKSASSTKEPSE